MRWLFALLVLACSVAAAQPPLSGLNFQGEDVRRLQQDDFANPGMLWIERGERLWRQARGAAGIACFDCHGEASRSMRGVAARLPAWDTRAGRVTTLDQRIDACTTIEQRDDPRAAESPDQIALIAYVTLQSRGLPMMLTITEPLQELFEHGRTLYHTRIGQMNLACADCHEQSVGKTLYVERISQGQPTAWPAYRLEWQSMGSLERRLRACFIGLRAEMPVYRSYDLVALQVYLGWRARQLPLESPGVRH
jgi:sulfur-oxidizing protein SoxA